MAKHVVLVGGGHAHLTVLKKIDDFIAKGSRVTVIGPSHFHYYSGMGPGLLSGIYRPEEVRFHIQKMIEDRGGVFVPGKVVRIDADKRRLFLESGDDMTYDVLSFNTGSLVPKNGALESDTSIYPVKPIENLLNLKNDILARISEEELKLLVIGGGPAGLELTGNLWRLINENKGKAKITFLAGHQLLASYPEKIRKLSYKSLSYRGIEVVEGANVKRLGDGKAVLENDREFSFDYALLAWGVKPSPVCKDSGLTTDNDGGLLVNEYLQSIDHPEIFGGGDCISFQPKPIDKVGVYPVRENPILYHNLLATVTGEKMMSFEPQDEYLLIFNLGDGTGLYWKKNWIWKGRLGFYIKNYIDKKFMKEFQVSGELD